MKEYVNPLAPKALVGPLKSSPYIHRYPGNPLLTSADIPYHCNLAFNAGVNTYQGRYYMAFRYDVFKDDHDSSQGLIDSGTGLAESSDGLHWTPHPRPVNILYKNRRLTCVNDSRISVLEGKMYLSFCFNSLYGERPGIAEWKGGDDFEVIYLGVPNQRNMILWNDRVNGKYMRLERPINRLNRFDIWLSSSDDLVHWGESELLLGVDDVPFATFKLGGAASPLRTSKGYLMFFHAVDTDPAREVIYSTGPCSSRYTCGAALLDLENPYKVIGLTQRPLLVAEEAYETGDTSRFWREYTVFPCGVVMEENQMIRLYYGAGDYSTCLAEIALSDVEKELTPYTRKEAAVVSYSDMWNGYFGWK